ncbi:isocitrate lyase/PEP mutase family protein [Chromobacterium violaceum]|uniref:Oxaloacetate decarboxylase n=1 Tax=Chromobacterium violaceum TaxID=536 RepID=A0AAX2MG00_CHRVL|nr:isocitrate lyase/phosphoenolpyruvate mutase family protein [Chromobacterium violaceum]OLZ78910.1 carboxyvinyl-carboxyphosphonate phosphorylmutase [Chromobacterium violaceum]STB69754.1 Oxaloacetate decarboxylase [Chromobacterium violaceum]SUX35225.1 Oxaloacetate decarboxylase [Chromobacterium violaceum]
MDFAQLHRQAEPLLLANVWDTASARLAEAAGYAAIGTSSAAISDMLGYPDGEAMGFAELIALVARLRSASSLPLTVDLEAGYGESAEAIVANLQKLAALGVVGVNLEDSVVRNDRREMVEAEAFSRCLREIRSGLLAVGVEMFLNARTDAYLLGRGNACQESIVRGGLYAVSGADGLFVPGVTGELDIAAIAAAVPLPLNVMCMSDLPSFQALSKLGVKRISMGNFLYERMQQTLGQLLGAVKSAQSFQAVFDHAGH